MNGLGILLFLAGKKPGEEKGLSFSTVEEEEETKNNENLCEKNLCEICGVEYGAYICDGCGKRVCSHCCTASASDNRVCCSGCRINS